MYRGTEPCEKTTHDCKVGITWSAGVGVGGSPRHSCCGTPWGPARRAGWWGERGPKARHVGDRVPVPSPFPTPDPQILSRPAAPKLPLSVPRHGFSQLAPTPLRTGPNFTFRCLPIRLLVDFDAVPSQWRQASGTNRVLLSHCVPSAHCHEHQ